MQTVNIELGERSYPIYIGNNLLAQQDLVSQHIPGQQVMVVTNDTIAPHYLNQLTASLKQFNTQSVILPDGEAHKNLSVLNQIFDALLDARFDRSCTVIALGGGVIGDMAGFAAASYQRGVNFIQIPTTLLAQVDSSVGGKTGVNHAQGKNMIGAFYQPRCVLADTGTISSLPDNELRAGLAEVIKYGFIIDAGFFDWLEENLDALLARDADALAYAIRRSCEIKADVVANDERERGQRALLNLGHTFGHAIEASMGYGQWLHGEAVSAGIVMAADLSQRLGMIQANEQRRGVALLEAAGLPTAPPASMTPDQFMHYMSRDKKTLGGVIRLILLDGIGSARVRDDFDPDALAATLRHFQPS
ncbi:MAG: 3-dehydroquinate synthase [Gammaproteobacteria bacterium]|nr:3-dehydroquinate synthase [Gammaproteobacteria bacterium]